MTETKDAFGLCVDLVINIEDGYVNDPDDLGGETRWGISKRSYPHVDIKNLSREGATAIYRKDYWQWCNGDALAAISLPVALMVFDGAVNQGKGRVCCWLQESVDALMDGHVGPNTLAALQRADIRTVLQELGGRRAWAYMLAPDVQRRKYGRGWGNRLLQITMVCAELLNRER